MELRGSDLPILIGQSGPLNGEMWEIQESIIIGRDPSCDIMIPDRQVSRYHARLYRDDNGILLEDLASKNGTYLNGKRIDSPEYVQDGDMLQVALVQHLVFLSSDATMPMEYDAPGSLPMVGRLRLDAKSKRVWIDAVEVNPPLSVPQFRLLEALFEQQGKVVSRQDLINAVWMDEAIGVTEQAFDALVRRLRDRLSAMDPTHNYVITVRGHGLRLDNPIK